MFTQWSWDRGVLILAPALGTLSLGAMYGATFEHQSERHDGCFVCTGAHCFRTAFIGSGAALVLASISIFVLARQLHIVVQRSEVNLNDEDPLRDLDPVRFLNLQGSSETKSDD